MSERMLLRLRRSAQLGILLTIAGAALSLGPVAPPVALGALAVLLWTLVGWGAYAAHVALNPALDRRGRTPWRVALWMAPTVAMPAYWFCHVRRPGERLT